MILDLNGYEISSNSNDYTINNKGSLKIIDTKYESELQNNSSAAHISSIKNSAGSTIKNNESSTLSIDDVTVESSYSEGSAVENKGNLKVEENGIVTGSNIAINNVSTGDILDGDGTISGGIGILMASDVDTGFKGYTLNSSTGIKNNMLYLLTFFLYNY